MRRSTTICTTAGHETVNYNIYNNRTRIETVNYNMYSNRT